MSEDKWLAALNDGDLSWFGELVDIYKDRVYGMAFRKTGNASDAEDLAQEIFLQFYRKLPLFRGEAALSTWLYRVAVNRATSYTRKRVPLPHPGAPPEIEAFASAPDERLLADERALVVTKAMAALRLREREVLELFYFQELPTARIASILSISARGVETRLRRARERMRRVLAEMGEMEEVDDCGKRPARIPVSKPS